MIVIITSCSASKDDSIQIGSNTGLVSPTNYLNDKSLLRELTRTRETIFSKDEANLGKRSTYAFDLYVRAGKAYKAILNNCYAPLKEMLIQSEEVQWFFLSGGYGIT